MLFRIIVRTGCVSVALLCVMIALVLRLFCVIHKIRVLVEDTKFPIRSCSSKSLPKGHRRLPIGSRNILANSSAVRGVLKNVS